MFPPSNTAQKGVPRVGWEGRKPIACSSFKKNHIQLFVLHFVKETTLELHSLPKFCFHTLLPSHTLIPSNCFLVIFLSFVEHHEQFGGAGHTVKVYQYFCQKLGSFPLCQRAALCYKISLK